MIPGGHAEVAAVDFARTGPKERVFKVSLRNFWLLSGIATPFIVALIGMGRFGLMAFPAETGDPFRFLTGYLPILVSVICFGGLLITFARNARRRIGVSPKYFLYLEGKGQPIHIRWEDVLYSGPRPDQRNLFPSALVSDGKNFIRFEKFFFTDFEEICEIIQTAKDNLNRNEIVI